LHGGYASVVFDDPVIHSLVKQRFGGWTDICKSDSEKITEMVIDPEDEYVGFGIPVNGDYKLRD